MDGRDGTRSATSADPTNAYSDAGPSSAPSTSAESSPGASQQPSNAASTSEQSIASPQQPQQPQQQPETIASSRNPFDDLFSGEDPFPRAISKQRWLTDPVTDRDRNRSRTRDRSKDTVPRSVLFTPESDANAYKSGGRRDRRNYDRSPLSRSEADAFMSLLHSALDPNLMPKSGGGGGSADGSLFPTRTEGKSQPFGAYTDLISHESPREKNRYQLEAYASRNRLRPRFEESRMARARKSAREGLAAQVSQAQLDVGIDEAREELTMCENEYEVWEWAKKEVWGLGSSIEALLPISLKHQDDISGAAQTAEAQTEGEASTSVAAAASEAKPSSSDDTAAAAAEEAAPNSTAAAVASSKPPAAPRFGKETPYFASVLHLVFLTLRDRYRSPHSALAVYDLTRSLGIESYVLGCTAALFTDLLRTRWDQLSDLESCRTLLRHARETGVLADPASRRRELMRSKRQIKGSSHDAIVPPAEDERIREVVDRIRGEARKEVLQNVQSRRFRKTGDIFAPEDLDEEQEAEQVKLNQPSWAQQQTLDLADELGKLAGPPSKLILSM